MEPRLTNRFRNSPIIAAVRDAKALPAAITSPCQVIFLLAAEIGTVASLVQAVKRKGKEALVHFDLVNGLGKDNYGLKWLAETAEPTGVITTRAALVARARSLGLVTVQRSFLVDSQSVQVTMEQILKTPPDFLEVLPGIAPDGIRLLAAPAGCPIIAGGLIRTAAQVKAALAAGAVAISTSDEGLWYRPGF